MADKSRCDNGFIWNPSVCEYECDKSCDIGKYFQNILWFAIIGVF